MNSFKKDILFTLLGALMLTGISYAQDGDPGEARISKVTFSGGVALTSDDASTTYTSDHWVDLVDNADAEKQWPDGSPDVNSNKPKPDNVKSFPYSYSATQTPTVKAYFARDKDAKKKKVEAMGKAISAGTSFELPWKTLNNGNYPATAADKKIVDTRSIRYFCTSNRHVQRNGGAAAVPLKIEWKVKIDGEEFEGGTSEHTVYLTWDKPSTTLLKEMVFNVSTSAADSLTAATDQEKWAVVSEIWKDFSDRIVHRQDGKPLTYWKGGAPPFDPSKLIETTDGTCQSWATLFIECAKVHGIDNLRRVDIYPFPVERKFQAPDGTTVVDCVAEGLQVKAIPAQSHPNPTRLFVNHSVVTWGANFPKLAPAEFLKPQALMNVLILDPSYGTVSASNRAWETSALDGIRYSAKPPNSGKVLGPEDPDKQDATFLTIE